MPGKIRLETTEHEGYRLLSVAGEVDMQSSPRLRDELKLQLKGTGILKLDLRNVSYLDSSGIAVLIQGMKWAQRERIDYRLVDPSEQVRSVIELAQLQDFFSIESSGESG
ncbi:MAG: STAS domain-containing protein [Planctomycetota bacterium]